MPPDIYGPNPTLAFLKTKKEKLRGFLGDITRRLTFKQTSCARVFNSAEKEMED